MNKIREATDADFSRVIVLYAQLGPDDLRPESDAVRQAFDAIARADNLHLFLLEDDDGLVRATCYLNILPNLTRGASPYGLIENVVTDASARRKGLGKSLITQTLGFAWDRGCYKVMLLSGSQRGSVHDFYRACGFDADEKRGFVARRPGWPG